MSAAMIEREAQEIGVRVGMERAALICEANGADALALEIRLAIPKTPTLASTNPAGTT